MIVPDSAEHARFKIDLLSASGWSDLGDDRVVRLKEIADTLDDQGFPGAIVPALINGSMVYYAIAANVREWRRLRSLLTAAVGPTLADFEGAVARLDGASRIEGLLRHPSIGFVSRFSAASSRISPGERRALETETVNALSRLVRLLQRADAPERSLPRSTQQILGEFRLALFARDRNACVSLIENLRSGLQLDAFNLYFLQVQLREAFGEWRELVADPYFRSLCESRRPSAVTSAMLEALFNTRISEPLESRGAADALNVFREQLAGPFGGLFTGTPPNPGGEVACVLALAAVAADDGKALSALQDHRDWWKPSASALFDRIAALRAPESSAFDLSPAAIVLRDAMLGEPSMTGARAVLLAAIDVHTIEAFGIASTIISTLNADGLQELLTSPVYAAIVAQVQSIAGAGAIPQTWREWARQLPKMSLEQARNWAEHAVAEWPVSQQLRTGKNVAELTSSFGEAFTASEKLFEDALPSILAWLREDNTWPNPMHLPLYEFLIDVLLVGSVRSPAALDALYTLLDVVLGLGLSTPAYTRIMNSLCEYAPSAVSGLTIDNCLDFAELLIVHPCPDADARARFWGSLASALRPFTARLDHTQLLTLKSVSVVLGHLLADLLITRQDALIAPPELEKAQLLAIYTLDETAGRRAQEALREFYPSSSVEVCTDLVGGPRLRDLAGRADVFVVTWTSAKHSATDSIKQVRGGRGIVYARGGSTGIVRAVTNHLSASTA